jgi:hypothetical protein
MSDDNDHDRDRDHADDNGEHDESGSKQVAPVLTGGALAALNALATDLAKVNTAAIIGRSGKPMLLFKREGSGTWMFGQKKTITEPGSRWAVNPLTFQWGYICFGDNNKKLGEHLVSISEPKPLITDLPNLGFPWQEEWAVEMKCLDGADAGIEVVHKANTDGGVKAIVILFDDVRDQLNRDLAKPPKERDGKIVAITLLEKESYVHKQYGKQWKPVFNIVGWMPLSGPAPTPEPEPEPVPPSQPSGPGPNTAGAAEQPRRRRVA